MRVLTIGLAMGIGVGVSGAALGQVNLGSLGGLTGKTSAGAGANLSSDQAAGGLKEALSQGISTAVASTGKTGGFMNNPAIRIWMPAKLQLVERGLRAAGQGAKIDAFIASMNAAAEEAAPKAKPILTNALKQMTFTDAKGIVTGGKTSGTEYFQKTSTAEIQAAFKPGVEAAMAKTGVTQQFDALMSSAPKMPFGSAPTLDINKYVLDKATDGLFHVMGEEETKIRTNPAAQVTPLLKTVFGGR